MTIISAHKVRKMNYYAHVNGNKLLYNIIKERKERQNIYESVINSLEILEGDLFRRV